MTRRHGAGGTYESVLVLHLVGFGLHYDYAVSHGAFRDGRRVQWGWEWGWGSIFCVYGYAVYSVYTVYLFCLLYLLPLLLTLPTPVLSCLLSTSPEIAIRACPSRLTTSPQFAPISYLHPPPPQAWLLSGPSWPYGDIPPPPGQMTR